MTKNGMSKFAIGILVDPCPYNPKVDVILGPKKEKLVGCPALSRDDKENCVHLCRSYRGCPFATENRLVFA